MRGRAAGERIRGLRATSEAPYVCTVNIEELSRGAGEGDERSMAALLEGLRLAPLGRREGEVAGRWRRGYARRGITLSQADCLVAAAAAGVDARLVTGNPKDFPMPEVTVEHWPAGA